MSPELLERNTTTPATNESPKPGPTILSKTARKPLARLVTYYLPQYHPIPENDVWWEKGFTEWTNVTKAKPLYRGHHQPNLPADLGYYDLRVPEVRQQQADMAREAGIEAFLYWHYWFGDGKKLLERPLEEVLASGRPDFPFCMAWANENWSGIWHGTDRDTLMVQEYPGEQDHRDHFEYLLPFFRDRRYLKVYGKPLFLIYRPDQLPECTKIVQLFRILAQKAGLPGLHIVAYKEEAWNPKRYGFDAATFAHQSILKAVKPRGALQKFWREKITKRPVYQYDYADAVPYMHGPREMSDDHYPSIVPGWDNSARCGRVATILHNSTPELFRAHVKNVLSRVVHKPFEQRLVFVKSWNEWAEANYMEPDQRWGRAYLETLRDEVFAATPPQAVHEPREFRRGRSWRMILGLAKPSAPAPKPQVDPNRAEFERAAPALAPLVTMRDLAAVQLNAQLEAVKTPEDDGAGEIMLRSSGTDPFFLLPAREWKAQERALLMFDISTPGPTDVQVYFQTAQERQYAEARSLKWPVDGGRNQYYIILPPVELFGRLRIDRGKLPGDYVLHRLELRTL